MVLSAHLHDTLFQNIYLELKSRKFFLNFHTECKWAYDVIVYTQFKLQ